MTVMTEGFCAGPGRSFTANTTTRTVPRCAIPPSCPWAACRLIPTAGCGSACGSGLPTPAQQTPRYAFQSLAKFDSEFRHGLGYHQPAGALASLGVMGAGTGATQSKYVARRETPVYIAENCTQCMECITACPDTALPNTSQEVATVLKTAALYYVTDGRERARLVAELKGLEERARAKMNDSIKAKSNVPFKDIIRDEVNALPNIAESAKAQFSGIIDKLPIAYSNVPAIFRSLEQKTPGAGGLFSIFVSDLCKGCGECVQVCGDHDAPAHGHGNGGVERAVDHRPDFLPPAARHPAKIPRPLQRLRRRQLARRRPAQPPHGPPQLRGARGRRRRVRRVRREKRAARLRQRHRSLHAAALSQEGRPPARQGRPAWRTKAAPNWTPCASATRPNTGCSSAPWPTSSWASAAKTTRTPPSASRNTKPGTAQLTGDQIVQNDRLRACARRPSIIGTCRPSTAARPTA